MPLLSAHVTRLAVPKVSRRRFLQGAAATTGAVAFAGCGSPPHEFQVESRPRMAEDILSGYENFYATTCAGCSGGCGLIVRVVDGRARKMEGNPAHPVNGGKLCARGQAGVQLEYHPDRLRGPLTRFGQRGQAAFNSSWDEGLGQLASRLTDLQRAGRGASTVLLTRPLRGTRAVLAQRFIGALGGQWLTLDPTGEMPLREAVRRVLGQDTLPEFDVQHANYVLSFGADFLSTWLSPVHYAVQYGVLRQGQYDLRGFQPGGRPRGYLVHVEPRFSGTAANADMWLPVTPGREGLLALSLAQVMVSEGLADPAAAGALGGAQALDTYRPEQAAGETGIAADRVRQVARDFATHKPSVALAGGAAGAHTSGTDSLAAILALNALVGAIGQPGGVLPNPPPAVPDFPASQRVDGLGRWQGLIESFRAGEVDTVLIYDTNPVYELPAAMGFREALGNVPFIASFSSFQDETTAMADLVLPSNLPLEDWGDDVPDAGPGFQVVTSQQPVVSPLFDTRGFWDVLLTLAAPSYVGGPLTSALPWPTFKDALRDSARSLQQLNRGSAIDSDFERFWVTLRQRGGWWDTGSGERVMGNEGTTRAAVGLRDVAAGWQAPEFAGDATDFPFYLLPFQHNTLGMGETAQSPWLQATPDPVTTVVWNSWVEINPKVAKDHDLSEGDVVKLESPQGSIEVPVYVSPAAPPSVLAIPFGQGHSSFGRWGSNRGANPMAVLAPLTDNATGALAYAATRVRLTKTGRHIDLSKFEGTVPAYQISGSEVLKTVQQ